MFAVAAFSAATPLARTADKPPADPDLVNAAWPSDWVACAGVPGRNPGVFHFRKRMTLTEAPQRFVVHISGDNRFVFFVNGTRVGEGPARGDLDHWRYETFDLAPYLRSGENTLAATVWNYGALAPTAQMSDQSGFLVQGDTNAEASANTDTSWEAEEEKGEVFQEISGVDLPNYYAASPGEVLDANRYDWSWQTSPSGWKHVVTVGTGEPGRYPKATPVGTGSGVNRWLLVPDPLPPMEFSETTIGKIVRVEGMAAAQTLPATVPAHASVRILFDRETMTTAYPELVFGRGKGAVVKVVYAEALVDAKGHKGNRNEIAGRHILGLTDTVIADGESHRAWSPLWWRSWRYLQLNVETGDEPLVLKALNARFTGYPFVEKGSFSASDPSLSKLWEVGTRTARMNAHETYMDCAYWEQLQYIGDTRIQALISYVQFGDDRLARQALDAYDNSRISEGLSQSRYPSALNQVIPTFSLLWIGMLHDFWMYRPDNGALAGWVPHTRSVIEWYARHQRPDGLLGRMPWWNFGDWTKDFVFGEPPQDADGGSALLSLYYVAALRDAADLEAYLGNTSLADADRRRAADIARAVYALCWDSAHGLLADTPAHAHFSEQTNTLGVLLDVVPADGHSQQAVMQAVLNHAPAVPVPAPGEFSPASVYFRFYVARALAHAKFSDFYLYTLDPWRRMLGIGLTTFAETTEPTRSDDHAWSAHPDYDLLTLVAGIRPGSPGFATVVVEPHPASLTEINARMPHPAGEITEHARLEDGAWTFDVSLPPGVTGTFIWGDEKTALASGPNHLSLRR